MPGLTLTLAQAGRLWSLDTATCADVLSHLVSTGFLCRRPDGAFCRASQQTLTPATAWTRDWDRRLGIRDQPQVWTSAYKVKGARKLRRPLLFRSSP